MNSENTKKKTQTGKKSEASFSGKLNLSIDTTFAGGSVALYKDHHLLDFQTGEGTGSKSAGILSAIEAILRKNDWAKKDLDKLFVSGGPGSYTGIRIGLAFARGFCKSLKCTPFAVSITEALKYMDFGEMVGKKCVYGYMPAKNNVFSAGASDNDNLSNGANLYKNDSEISVGKYEFSEFLKEFSKADTNICLYLNPEILSFTKTAVSNFEKETGEKIGIVFNTDLNLAKYIGIAGLEIYEQINQPDFSHLEPLYL